MNSKDITHQMEQAVINNNIDLLKRLATPLSHPISYHPLVLAAQNGHLEMVKYLIPLCDPKSKHSLALRIAVQNGWTEVVKVLMPVSDIKAEKSAALIMASGKGFVEIVQLLLVQSSPKAQKSKALGLAVQQGHHACVELLYPVSHPIAALKELQFRFPNRPEKWQMLENLMQSERQRKRLLKVVGENQITHAKKM